MRKGIDDDHLTYVEAGLHRRRTPASHGSRCTPARRRSATRAADWEAIATPEGGAGRAGARQRRHLGGRRRPADGAPRPAATASSSAAAASAGRGCSPTSRRPSHGRPERRALPSLGEVATVMRRHAELLAEWLRHRARRRHDFRKHVAWYLKGFPVGSSCGRPSPWSSSLSELDDLLGKLDPDAPFPVGRPGSAARTDELAGRVVAARGLAGRPRRRRPCPRAPSSTTPAADRKSLTGDTEGGAVRQKSVNKGPLLYGKRYRASASARKLRETRDPCFHAQPVQQPGRRSTR